jgi:hypothetical protein
MSQGLHGVAVFDPAWRGAGVFRLRSEEHFRVNLSCSYFHTEIRFIVVPPLTPTFTHLAPRCDRSLRFSRLP